VDSNTQSVYTTATGDIDPGEFYAHVQALVAANLFKQPQLIDTRAAHYTLSSIQVRKFADFLKQYRMEHGPTRVAFVTTNDALYGMMRMLMILSEDYDPGFNVFRDYDEAEQWIRM